MFKGYAGAVVPRLQNLMDDAAKATEPTPNATIVDDEDRAASAQLYWMMLMICKGAALNTVFLAGDSEGLEAWRQLTEKYEPKMRTRFAGQLMSTLSFSFQGDTIERISAWEREMATYERDSGKILVDEIKVGAVLPRLPESQLRAHLLMRVEKLKKSGQTSETKWMRFPVRLQLLSHSRHRWTLEQWTRGDQARVARDRKQPANVTIRLSKRVLGAETLITLLQPVLTLTKRAENVERLVIWQVCVDPLELLSPRPRAARKAKEVAKVRMLSKLVGIVVRVDMSSQCSKKKVHSVEESTTASQAGSQDTIMVGSVGSYFDVGSVSEVTLEPRSALHETFSACVEVTTLRLVATNCTSSAPGSWVWRLQTCEAML